ncbi:histone-like nucleoid-structuring protein Lsr2 [Streptomyces sp. NPDC059593]|uniref:Lsr2 family DNA-binding protein n=1 Tax=Streptomyces sp. NPDC059593 TaxID=3346878 RepID=UPI00369599B9
MPRRSGLSPRTRQGDRGGRPTSAASQTSSPPSSPVETLSLAFPDSLLTQGVSFTPTTPAPPTTIGTAPQPPTSTTADTNDIRDWARANGYDVPDRGRMPVAILDAWKKAGNQ